MNDADPNEQRVLPFQLDESALRDILETIVDGVVTIDESGRILWFNSAAERIFGWTKPEIIGKNVGILIPEPFRTEHDDYVAAYLTTGIRKIIGIGREVQGRRKDGTIVPIDLAVSESTSGSRRTFTGIVRDITERKRTEQALRDSNRHLQQALAELQERKDEIASMTQQMWQAAKLATVGELAAGIAHELNNPLATVGLRIEALLNQVGADDPRRRLLEIIEQEVERMGRLVSNLLQFSRRGHDQISTINIHEELERALELIAPQLRQRKIRTARELGVGLPLLCVDRQKLRQVLLNVMSNANDAMPAGGTLTLRTASAILPDGRPGVAVEICDTGVGIPAENLDRVMEPFFTTKEQDKGTGLGLPICRRIIQAHRGTIDITSAAGQGTTVRIALPQQIGDNRVIE